LQVALGLSKFRNKQMSEMTENNIIDVKCIRKYLRKTLKPPVRKAVLYVSV